MTMTRGDRKARARSATPGGARPAARSADELIAEAGEKARAVLVEKHAWTGKRLQEIDHDLAALERRRERLQTEMLEVDAERTALAAAIEQLGGEIAEEPS
jgi:predicted  nucleic acid-binding Zn-ribbon protein